MLAALVLAQSTPAAGVDMLGPILNVGLVGVILLLLSTETLFITTKSHKREITAKDAEIDRLRGDVEDLKQVVAKTNEFMTGELVPLSARMLDLGREYVETLRAAGDREPRRRRET